VTISEWTVVQRLFIDGIAYSVKMIDASYNRLKDTALRLAEEKRVPAPEEFTEIFQSAWFIVEATERLRRLIAKLPGLKQKDPQISLFFNQTRSVEELRNFIQHAEGDVPPHQVSVADPRRSVRVSKHDNRACTPRARAVNACKTQF
jgi:hypothetical protein